MAPPETANRREAAPATTREREVAAVEACRRAEELFRGGNFPGACRHARRAQQRLPGLPGVANVLAAYAVHAVAAAGSSPGRPNWRAVLGFEKQAAAPTHDAIKRQFRRLALLVHPDKNRSAAAEGAFKILRHACDVALLSPDGCHRCSGPTGASAAPPQSARPPAGFGNAADTNRSRPPAGAEGMPGRPAAGDTNRNRPAAGAGKQGPRRYKRIYCWHCKREFGRQVGPVEELVGTACPRCNMRLRPPWDRKTLLDFTVLGR